MLIVLCFMDSGGGGSGLILNQSSLSEDGGNISKGLPKSFTFSHISRLPTSIKITNISSG